LWAIIRSSKSFELIPSFMSWYPVSLTFLIPSNWDGDEIGVRVYLFPSGCSAHSTLWCNSDHISLMESHDIKALVSLLQGQSWLFNGELQVHWKYVVNHVRNFGNTFTLIKKDMSFYVESQFDSKLSHLLQLVKQLVKYPCFLLQGQSWLFNGELQEHWKYVVNHVRNFENTLLSLKKDMSFYVVESQFDSKLS
jgi:hypothetical protein